MNHTQGPWMIMNSGKIGFVNIFGTHSTGEYEAYDFVCEIGPGARVPGYEAHANARLIKMAPQMLEALQDLTALYEASPGRDQNFVKKAQAIIREATT